MILVGVLAGSARAAQPSVPPGWHAREEARVLLALREKLPPLKCQLALNAYAAPYTEGKHSLLLFWAPWCGPCKLVLEELTKLATAQPPDIAIATASEALFDGSASDPAYGPEGVGSMLSHYSLAAPTCVYQDAKQKLAWEAEGIPMLFLFGPTGRLERVAVGGDRGAELVRELSAGWRPASGAASSPRSAPRR